MTIFTNYLENKLIDHIFRGQAYTPPTTLYVGLFTASPGDTGSTAAEVTGGNYARKGIACSLANWSSTSGAGTTTASTTGASATTSNNVAILFDTPSANWGLISHYAIFDQPTGGNMLFHAQLNGSAGNVNFGDAAPSFAPGALQIQLDNGAFVTDYLENKLVDFLFRGQAFPPPTSLHFGLYAGTQLTENTANEVTGGGYARVSLACSLANWSATDGAGQTVASSGSSGTTSNNVAIQFPDPTGSWGTVTGFMVFDAPTAGNPLLLGPLQQSKVIGSGVSAPYFGPGNFSFTID